MATLAFRLQVVQVPVSDLDRAASFYADRVGFALDHDVRMGERRFVQLTPPGSSCSIVLGQGGEPGSVQGLQLVVGDIAAARSELVGRGVDVGEVTVMASPERDGARFASFRDPDGNGWLLQEIRAPATRVVPELAVMGGRAAIDFYVAAFGAEVDYRVGDESVVAQLSVAGTPFWVADAGPRNRTLSPLDAGGGTVRMLLVVADPEALVARAEAAGASVLSPVGEEHGWLLGRIVDPFGHQWEVGRPLGPWPNV